MKLNAERPTVSGGGSSIFMFKQLRKIMDTDALGRTMFLGGVLASILLFSQMLIVHAYEINTHQAMTRCAITSTNACSSSGQTRAQNLVSFIEDAGLGKKAYMDKIFEGYERCLNLNGTENYYKQCSNLDFSVTQNKDCSG